MNPTWYNQPMNDTTITEVHDDRVVCPWCLANPGCQACGWTGLWHQSDPDGDCVLCGEPCDEMYPRITVGEPDCTERTTLGGCVAWVAPLAYSDGTNTYRGTLFHGEATSSNGYEWSYTLGTRTFRYPDRATLLGEFDHHCRVLAVADLVDGDR